MSTQNNKFQELSKEEQAKTDGGSILGGGDDNSSMIQLSGFVSISQTDENGDTSSTDLSFGTDSMFQNSND